MADGGETRRPPVVAVDGPAGAGKSTVCREVARRCGLTYLDTGALYRAIGYTALQRGIDPLDDHAMEALCQGLDIEVATAADGTTRVVVDGEDVTTHLRTPEVSLSASRVSARPPVRARLLDLQRRAAARGGVIVDGRDIGTVVLPDADLKIFLTASPEERARRRHQELAAKGDPATYEATLADVIARDAADSGRAIAPLKAAADAVTVDTSDTPFEQVVTRLCARIAAA